MSYPQQNATWKLGANGNCIVSDKSEGIYIGGVVDKDSIMYYGGFLVCESIQKEVAEYIIDLHNRATQREPAYQDKTHWELWNDSSHGVQPATNFKQVPPEDYYRAMECVNALAGIENVEEFVRLAKSANNQILEWEQTLMRHLGEDGTGSVVDAINKMKAEINTLRSKQLSTLTETDQDNLCDIVWWLKGYKKGADNTFNECPFVEDHLDSLNKVVLALREILNKSKK